MTLLKLSEVWINFESPCESRPGMTNIEGVTRNIERVDAFQVHRKSLLLRNYLRAEIQNARSSRPNVKVFPSRRAKCIPGPSYPEFG